MLDSLKRTVRDPTKTVVSGVSILLLQKKLERFSPEAEFRGGAFG
jgi:hypothetical protein